LTDAPARSAQLDPSESGRDGVRRGWIHAASVAWLVVMALAVLAPVLIHGSSFGSYDVLSQFGVLRQPGLIVHNVQAGDQSDQIIPWATLAWTQVHHGHLPLWNPYEGLGMPLAFNWQTAAFSLPTLIGYLFPLHLTFTVQVVLTLVIAGTGTYALCRVLQLGTLACVFAATAFELSGPMLGWLGWPHAAVLSWSGWLFAAALLVVGGRRRLRNVVLLALAVAAMIYAGQAEIFVFECLALGLFVLCLLVQRMPVLRGQGPIAVPVLDLGLGMLCGVALGAPLLLPGLQVVSGSQHNAPGGDPAEIIKGNPPLPAHNLVHVLFQGFDGLPVAGSHWFGYIGGYSETAAYVGVTAVVLALTGLAVCRRKPEVLAFGILCAAMVVTAFFPPLVSLLYHLPAVGTVLWQRAILPLAFGLAVLSGVGLDALLQSDRDKAIRWATGGFAGAGVLLAALWFFGRGDLPEDLAHIRAESFWWPLALTALGLAVVGVLARARRREGAESSPVQELRRRRAEGVAGVVLLAGEAAFLIAAGLPLWTSTSTPFASTPAMAQLQSTIGSSTLGLGSSLCFLPPGLGVPENAQVAYGLQELAIYDPMIPRRYYASWHAVSDQSPGNANDAVYCPGIDTTRLARLYGVSYVVERAGSAGPRGGVYVKSVGDEDLYRIPGAGAATETPLGAAGGEPADTASGTPLRVTHDDPSSWKVVTDAARPQVVRFRLTDVPGWHATVDGRSVPLRSFASVMLQLDVPAGRHTVTLHYWPTTFTLGLVLCGIAVAGIVVGFVVVLVRRRSPSSAS
jgi:uncharacterized integral membrane protein